MAGKSDAAASKATGAESELAQKILAAIESAPLYYSELAEQLRDYKFAVVARTFGQLHAEGKLWQDPRGRICLKGSKFAAKL